MAAINQFVGYQSQVSFRDVRTIWWMFDWTPTSAKSYHHGDKGTFWNHARYWFRQWQTCALDSYFNDRPNEEGHGYAGHVIGNSILIINYFIYNFWRWIMGTFVFGHIELPIAKIITSRLPTQKVSPESRWFFNLWFLFKQHTLILIRDSLQSDKIVLLILFGQIYIVQYFMLHVYYFMNA